MFDKIKKAITGWNQDSPSSRPSSPSRGKKDNNNGHLKSTNSFRNSLPARLRTSIYREQNDESSTDSGNGTSQTPVEPATTTPHRAATTAEGNHHQFSNKHYRAPLSSVFSPDTTVATSTPSTTVPSGEHTNHSSNNNNNNNNNSSKGSSTTSPVNMPPAQKNDIDTTDASPQSIFIRRTSSYQGLRSSTESNSDEPRNEDIIIFSSTPPVTIARSSSTKVTRAGSVHKGSPDQATAINSETPVVQWPRGGNSAASRSQEHFLRTHRRTSTSSDASIKDLQTPLSTTPPISSPLRHDSLTQRPALDRTLSRSGNNTAVAMNSTSSNAASPTAVSTSVSTSSDLNHSSPKTALAHNKTPSDASSASIDASVSTATTATTGAAVAGGVTSILSSGSTAQSPVLEQPPQVTKVEPKRCVEPAKVSSGDSVPPLNPAVARQLAAGTQMLKVSAKKQHSRLFKLDLEQGRILWDSRKFGRINVEQIKELRKGKAARMYREQLRVKPEHEERWLTIIYSAAGKYKALHLVAPTKDTYQDWIMAVERMWSVKREVAEGLPQLQRKTNQWLKEHWMDADKNVDSKLGYEEVVRLCHRLNINFSRKEIRLRFDQADEKNQGFLDFSNFTHFVKLLKERKEIINLFNRLTVPDDMSMSVDEFIDFMLHIQKTTDDIEHIREIYNKHLDKTVDKFTVDSLTSFLVSADNSIVAPEHAQVHQDMSQTLSNYYISSSHNTYLLGHQLTGISSIEGYIRALQSGCRCVELDCWDGPDGQPVIYHGHTLTSKILFRDVIEAISTYAFVNSPYPLILSLEIHCDLDQQDIMANIMRTKLGSWLVVAALDSESAVLPSPDELQFKILIKSKVLPPDATSQEFSTDTESESERESESDSESVKKPKTKSKKVRIARALSNITIYCQSRHFPGFTHDGCSPHKIISFSERVSLRLAKQTLQEYINMNKSHLTRVYPAGFRISSTNYDPHHHWAGGCQVVALNYQSYDRGMQMNNAMFTMNGHCGYVLKPQALRLAPGETCNHDKAPSFVKTYPVDVTLEIISAQQLPRPNEAQSGDVIDPVCEIEMLVPGQSTIKYKTRHVSDNGFNPVWQESFKFRVDYEHHQLVYFRFVVQDEDIKFSDLIASYCISLDSLQEGYRHIQLQDPSGEPYLYSTLFIKVSIQPVLTTRNQGAIQRQPLLSMGSSGELPPLPANATTSSAQRPPLNQDWSSSELPSLPHNKVAKPMASVESRSSTESSHKEPSETSETFALSQNSSDHSLHATPTTAATTSTTNNPNATTTILAQPAVGKAVESAPSNGGAPQLPMFESTSESFLQASDLPALPPTPPPKSK
ncbi:Phospholipase C [Mortierella hygrophila]|uniref:Phosphoinositide phospholipase C n=1 Tax=Mortierella hygrophila TaxID=979708 RepID=A0A9P6EYV8_9FUNG|nr:Phospholipase C [Mortierella hygrophila]